VVEGPFLAASEIEARGRGGPDEAVIEAADPEGETTEGRADVLTSLTGAAGFAEAAEPVKAEKSVGVLVLGGIGEPVAEGARGGIMDDRLLGGAGPEADDLENIVVALDAGFGEEMDADFLTVEGAVEVDLERVEEPVVGGALLEGAAFAAVLDSAAYACGIIKMKKLPLAALHTHLLHRRGKWTRLSRCRPGRLFLADGDRRAFCTGGILGYFMIGRRCGLTRLILLFDL